MKMELSKDFFEINEAPTILPEGEHVLTVKAASAGPCKSGDGNRIELELIKDDKTYSIKDWIVYQHSKAITQKLGNEKLRALQLAGKVPDDKANEPEAYIGKVVKAYVTVQTSSSYNDSNEIKKYLNPTAEEIINAETPDLSW